MLIVEEDLVKQLRGIEIVDKEEAWIKKIGADLRKKL